MKRVVERLRSGVLFCIKWRYIIALLVFVFCVAFKLHGSSISMYNYYFENEAEYDSESIVIGKKRGERTDEWLVQTPFHVSQTYNNFEKNSDMMSIDGQDMMVATNAPVADFAIAAKPFTWGYLMLGNEYGLSWYWCMKSILLVLFSFDFCMIITRKNKKVSLLGMLLIALAPPMQWWFSTSVIDVFVWGMALFMAGYYFFISKNKWYKNLCILFVPLIANAYAITLYPAMQIPVAFLMIAIFVAVLIRDKKEINFAGWADIWRLIAMAALTLALFLYIVMGSKDALAALAGTVYPGARVALGDTEGLSGLFTNIATFTLPFKTITYENNCEVSSFIHFAPVFLMLLPIIMKKAKQDKNKLLGKVLAAALIIVAIFMTVGFPPLLAKLTLFSYINRPELVYGFIATVFTIWGIDMIWRKSVITKKQATIVVIIYIICYALFIGEAELSYLPWWAYVAIILGFSLLAFLLLSKKKLFFLGMGVLMLLAGGMVNPIARGMSPLYEHPLEKKIAEIASSDKDAYWLTINWGNMLAPLCLVNGAKVLNAVNEYPDYGKWKLIDPDGEFDDVYNRYAHIHIILTDGKTVLTNNNGVVQDVVVARLNYKDLLRWPVKYLLVTGEPGAKLKGFKKIYDDTEGDYHIYERIK